MAQTFNQWANSVVGRYVDVDGSYGGQCWDTFAHYCINALGIAPVNTYGGQWSGWAYALWDQFYNNGAAANFHRVSASQPAIQGDVAVWNTSHWYYPASHVAVVINDGVAGKLYCVSQNSSPAQPWLPGYSGSATGPNIRQYLTKQGLAGYLRPNSRWIGDGPEAPAPPEPTPGPPPVVPPPRPLLIPGVAGLYADE